MAKKKSYQLPISVRGRASLKWLPILATTLGLSACLDHDHSATDTQLEFGDEYWAEEVANQPEYFPAPGGAEPLTERINVGSWEPLNNDWPLIATGVANMPDGKIMAWASFKKDTFKLTNDEKDELKANPSAFDLESTHGTIYDPSNNSFSPLFSSSHDMFCSGVSMLDDGSVFVAGGGDHVSSTSIFKNGQFSEIDSMNQTRWYPTSTTLASGQVVTAMGNIRSPNPEIWTEGHGWQVLDNVSMQTILDDTRYDYRDWYPALNVAPDGSVFHPGHLPELFSIDITADHDHSVHSHGDIAQGAESTLYNTTVMYDVGKMLVAGGGFGKYEKEGNSTVVDAFGVPVIEYTHVTNEAYTIDLNGNDPVVTPTSSMENARSMHNSVVLPDGKVFVVGGNGSGVQFSDWYSVHVPEMWDPATGQWTAMSRNAEPRNYHSTAILLKDGRVLAAGGGLCGSTCSSNHQDGRIYSPPYLFDAAGDLIDRPSINSGSSDAFPGQSILIQGSDDIVKFNMLRLVALTHHHSTDQRMVPTSFERLGAGQYRLDLNSNPNVLIPGYYWVFGLNANGTPTEGHTVQVKVATENIPAPPAAAQSQNVAYEYYELPADTSKLPDFDSMTATDEGFLGYFTLTQAPRHDNFAYRFRSTITVPADGAYEFFLASDNGSRLLINGTEVVDADGKTKFESAEKNGEITLTAGDHDIEVQHYQVLGGSALAVSWDGPGFSKRAISHEVLSHPDGSGGSDTGDGGTDATDGSTDAGAGTDAGDGGSDDGAGTDSGDAGTDAGTDTGHAGTDTGTDAGSDAGTDTGSDAGTDAGDDGSAGADGGADTGTDGGDQADGSADAGTTTAGEPVKLKSAGSFGPATLLALVGVIMGSVTRRRSRRKHG